jgi:hypothetical protein
VKITSFPHTYSVVIANDLDRHEDHKFYFGIEKLQLIIEQALEDTKPAGRVSAIQRITISIISPA